jgi:AAA domain
MRLHRLKVTNFAGIGEVDIPFGPGLNVLFGPNDLGKSTLADAIRLALLLPYGSTDCEPYMPWAGGGDPVVDLTFATEEQRYWRVRKAFGKGGSAFLEESKNGRDFEEIERSRKVDGKLREILSWGIAEPGGSGAAKGLPESFLATVLLSTQSNVTAVLGTSLQDDRTGSGKERVAAALQAVAQDPMFLALLRETQARWDEAFTEKGTKSKAKGSVFKGAADRLNETRDEKDRLQKLVEESEGVEQQLRTLVAERATRDEAYICATELFAQLEELAQQAAAHAAAVERVRLTSEVVRRIRKLGDDVLASQRLLEDLVGKQQQAAGRRDEARVAANAAADVLKTAEEQARSSQADAEMADTVARQQLELRKGTADRAATEAQQAIAAAGEAQKLVDAVVGAEQDLQEQTMVATRAAATSAELANKQNLAGERLARCEILERGLAVRMAEAEVSSRQAEATRKVGLEQQLAAVSSERAGLVALRNALLVPDAAQLAPMRRLAAERANAQGALEVGLMVRVTPMKPPLELAVGRDGAAGRREIIGQSFEVEAGTELDLAIADVATVKVRGGRRDARERVSALEERWTREVAPHLVAAGAADLEALDAKVGEARGLDTRIDVLKREAEGLQSQLAALGGADDALRKALGRVADAQAALEGVGPETLTADLDALGADPAAGLRRSRQQASRDMEEARSAAGEASTGLALAEERVSSLRQRCEAAMATRDAALAPFPSGVAAAAENAQAALRATKAELQAIVKDLASMQGEREARAERLAEAIRGAREAADKAKATVETAEAEQTDALTAHAVEKGRLDELRKQLASENLVAAADAERAASDALASIPVPDRLLAGGELDDAGIVAARAKRDLEDTDREIQRAQGRLEQVGGAVAREHLHDAMEAFEQAVRYERELEADYEAWKLLLEQMKEADAAQASNLGQVLAPAIAVQFQALTAQRYQGVQLTAQLGTDGVMVGGNVRSHDRISVGTREQLSTIYRLCLGEYLRTTIVLDDQLVQSDGTRMDWFRGVLAAKARSFQIVVFTCRPQDYLASSAMPGAEATHADTEEGFVRAVDLGRAVRRR